MIDRKKLYFFGLLTLIGFPLLGITLIGFVESNPWEFTVSMQAPVLKQLLLGTLIGFVFAGVALFISSRSFLTQTLREIKSVVKISNLKWFDILFISACAGIGEELLFRGVIQHYIGVEITAIIFVAIHGYLNPKDWKISVYGVVMTFVMMATGYISDLYGIVTAIFIHFWIDVVPFIYLKQNRV